MSGKTVTLTLTGNDANRLLMLLNSSIVHYANKADRKNASDRVKRLNNTFRKDSEDLWRQVYEARMAAGVTFTSEYLGSN
jgi:hypothetical protein